MFNSLFGNLTGWFAKMMDFVLTWILNMLDFSLSFFSDNFPVVSDMYGILQGVGVGLVVAIAGFQLFKYFTGPLADVNTNPLEIGVRALISFALIWFGNYFLEAIVNLFTYPYDALLNVSATNDISIMESSVDSLASLLGGASGILLSLIMLIAVSWNVIKLILEIVERFLMIGVLTYTSPLAWPTLTSRSTQQIFAKWMSMFLGQCLLMLLNVWSIKMLISILSYSEANVFFKFIIALAFCKVAQRFDTYLQSLGINAAHTGGSLIDDIAAVGSAVSGMGSKALGNALDGAGNKALGTAFIRNGWTGGIANAIGGAVASNNAKSAMSDILNTPSGQESGIFKNPEGGYMWQDKNGNIWTAKNKADMEGVRAGIKQGYAQHSGESGISKDGRTYQWTDSNGNVHKSDSLPGILQEQAQVRAAYSAANGQNSKITQNPDGTYQWTDSNGNVHTSDTLSGIQAQQAMAQGSNMPVEHENEILQNPDGGYMWQDENGNVYTADTLEDIQAQRAMAQSSYTPIGQESEITQNPDGTYQWTDKNGAVWRANTLSDMQATRATVRNGYADNTINNGSISSLKGKSASTYASQMFNANGTPKSGVTTFDSYGREILAGTQGQDMANKIAYSSNPAAMATGAGTDNVSAIKAATIASHSEETAQALMNANVMGGIQDERVTAATYNKLFGNGEESLSEKGIDSVIPGLSQSVAATNGEWIDGTGDVADLHMNDGEMCGTYIPNGEDETNAQTFSIRTGDSIAKLSPEEQKQYTAFEGADGQTYFAKSSDVQLSSIDSVQNQTDIPATTIKDSGTVSGVVDGGISAPTTVETPSGQQIEMSAPVATVEDVSGISGSSVSEISAPTTVETPSGQQIEMSAPVATVEDVTTTESQVPTSTAGIESYATIETPGSVETPSGQQIEMSAPVATVEDITATESQAPTSTAGIESYATIETPGSVETPSGQQIEMSAPVATIEDIPLNTESSHVQGVVENRNLSPEVRVEHNNSIPTVSPLINESSGMTHKMGNDRFVTSGMQVTVDDTQTSRNDYASTQNHSGNHTRNNTNPNGGTHRRRKRK